MNPPFDMQLDGSTPDPEIAAIVDAAEERRTPCFLCGERPAHTKDGWCKSCFSTHWNNEFWRQRRAEHAARMEEIAREEARDRRTFLSMYQGAQVALTALKLLHPEKDFSSALKQCRERIKALENSAPNLKTGGDSKSGRRSRYPIREG